MAGGVELGTAERTSDFTRNSTVPIDVTSLSVTVAVGARPIEISFSANSISNDTGTGGVAVSVVEDGVNIGGICSSIFTAASQACSAAGSCRRAPAAGSHTYKIQLATIVSGTAKISASTGAAAARLQVNEI